ncbi:MAG: hypothetical protein A2148_10635 [Chloroflexi bacterium RBG_16_68_14]|nr:MAG: hypothetical protein A2148_10635 [Chloroflexi bacterium RBG_16_68_14]
MVNLSDSNTGMATRYAHMMAVQGSGPRRKRLVVAGLLAGLALAVLAGASLLATRLVNEEANDPPAAILVQHGDHCYLVPSSCSGLTTVTNVWAIGDGSITIAQDMPLRAADSPDSDLLSEALVLLPTPPPRSA